MPTSVQARRHRAAGTVREYQRRYGQLTADVVARVEAIWDQTGGLTEADARRFRRAVTPVSIASQRATRQLVISYLQSLAQQLTDERIPYRVADIIDVRGITSEVEWQRPIVEARMAIARENPFDEAIRRGRQRAADLARADVMLTQRATTAAALSADSRVVGYRRVLTGVSCVFCATVSTQRYKSSELMPVHQHCDCTVAPIIGTEDPGRVVNADLLDRLRTLGPQYWMQRGYGVDEDGNVFVRANSTSNEWSDRLTPQVAVREHGEFGPVLVDPLDNFTGPQDLDPTRVPDTPDTGAP
jgi:hypothetical protein